MKYEVIIENWNNFLNEQTEPFQKKVKQGYVKDRNQYLKGGKGKPSKPFNVEPSKIRAKSAPPIGESSTERIYEIDEGVMDSLKNAASNTKSAIKDLGRRAGKAAAVAGTVAALGYGGATVKASSDRIDAARQTQSDQIEKDSRPTLEYNKILEPLHAAIMKDVNDHRTQEGKEQLINNLIKVFHINKNVALAILNMTTHGGAGGTPIVEGSANLATFINVAALVKYDLKANNKNDSHLSVLQGTAELWGGPTGTIMNLATKHNIHLNQNQVSSVGFNSDGMGTVKWGVKENIWTSIDSELLIFEHIEEIYQIDENLWKDLTAKFTKSKQIEKKKNI